jgi:hypothetical protein
MKRLRESFFARLECGPLACFLTEVEARMAVFDLLKADTTP